VAVSYDHMRIKINLVLALLTVSTFLFAQSDKYHSVTGSIVDNEGLPLPGAVVQLSGSRNVAVADIDGNFEINLFSDKNSSITVTFLGMDEVKMVVTPQQSRLRIQMKSNNELDEVVVTGYGVVQKKETLTGSAFEMTSEKITKLPAARIDNLLIGQIPGLRVKESTTTEALPVFRSGCVETVP